MEFRVLGPLEASDNGDSVPLGGHRQRLVLAVLLLHANHAVSVDRLIDGVWGEVPPKTARKTLQTYIARLRKTIGEDDLTASDSGYVLHVESDQLDSIRFERLAQEGRDLITDDPSGASGVLGSALSEWRGSPWGDLGSEFALQPESERLKELRLVVREDRIEADLACGVDASLIPELQGLIAQYPWRERFAGQLMLALYRAGRQAEALRAFQRTRRALGEELGIEPSPELRLLEERILLQDPGLQVSTTSSREPTEPIRNPYKGLRAFGEMDSVDFFGRKELSAELIERVCELPFVAVVGPSGSGKSSVVKAGVLQELRRTGASSGRNWLIATMVPGAHPFEELEAALLRVATGSVSGLVDQMRGDDLDVLRCVLRILPTEQTHLLLVIDQFEELFVLTEDPKVRNRFFRNIVQAVDDLHRRLTILATLRADFYDQVLSEPDMGPLVDRGLVNILPLTTTELDAAALGPAHEVGAEIEAELLAELIADIHDQPGALPLFQYVLTELYQQRDLNVLTLAAYNRIGGLRGALARRANETYEGLDSDQQETARQVFLRLVMLREDGETTRQRVLRADLEMLGTGEDVVRTVLDRFDNARLLTFDRDCPEHEATVEVAHEALFREWGRLRRWIDDAHDDLRLHRSLVVALHEWDQSDRQSDYLLTGSRLAVLESWMQDTNLQVTSSERAFLDFCLIKRDSDVETEIERRDRELIVERRSVHRLQWLVGLAVVAALVAATLTVLAVIRGREAQASQRQARARELANASVANLEDDPERSILLALEAVETTRSVDGTVLAEAEQALHQSVAADRLVSRFPGSSDVVILPDGSVFTGGRSASLWDRAGGDEMLSVGVPGEPVFVVAVSADGQLLATGGADGSVALWDSDSGTAIREFGGRSTRAHDGFITSLTFNEEGTMLASGSRGDQSVRVWDISSGAMVAFVQHPDGAAWGPLPRVPQVSFHPDGTRIAMTGFWDATVKVYNIASGEWGEPFEGHEAPVFSAEYFADGSRIATSSVDGTIRIWDTESRDEIYTIVPDAHGVALSTLDVSDDGGQLAVVGDEGVVRVWRLLANGAQPTFVLSGHQSILSGVAFSPDGNFVSSAEALDDEVRVWDITSEGSGEWFTLAGGSPAIAFSPDSDRLATSTADGDVIILDTVTWDQLVRLDDGALDASEGGDWSGLAWSPDGTLVATTLQAGDFAVGPGFVGVWDASTGGLVRTLSDAFPRVDVAISNSGQVTAAICQFRFPGGPPWDSAARVWDLDTGEQTFAVPQALPPYTTCGHSADIDPVGHLLAVQTDLDIANVQIWDLVTGEMTGAFSHMPSLGSVRFSPDGQSLLTAGFDGAARIWDVTALDERLRLDGHSGAVQRAVWSSGGELIVTGDANGSIRFWDSVTGEMLLVLRGHQGTVLGLALSPDGTMLASSGSDGVTQVWAVDLEDLIAIATGRVTRTFSQTECVTYQIEACEPSSDVGADMADVTP